MKKLLALILCLCLSLGAVAFATELNKDVLEGQTTVSLTVDPDENSFVIVIPASVTVDIGTQEGTFDIVLKAGWKLVSANGLKVRIKKFANGTFSNSGDNDFMLKGNNGGTAYYELSYKKSTSTSYIPLTYVQWDDTELISVKKGDSNSTDYVTGLKIKVPTLPTTPGVYTDVITFAVTLN
ncbi:MAG: hypothetical protein E7318_00025 [Clostridiales bacterium]|nr:hypothetical protein [Clostridiales bacterium]